MVARKRLTAPAVGLTVGLLAQHAAGAEAPVTAVEQQDSTNAELVVDARLFRIKIHSYVRELDRQIRAALNEELRRELDRQVELARNELRTQI
jgi:hypothetical protein